MTQYPEAHSDTKALLGVDLNGLRQKYASAVEEGLGGFNVTGASPEDVKKLAEETGWSLYDDPEGLSFLKAPQQQSKG